jgi:hypothetical protein
VSGGNFRRERRFLPSLFFPPPLRRGGEEKKLPHPRAGGPAAPPSAAEPRARAPSGLQRRRQPAHPARRPKGLHCPLSGGRSPPWRRPSRGTKLGMENFICWGFLSSAGNLGPGHPRGLLALCCLGWTPGSNTAFRGQSKFFLLTGCVLLVEPHWARWPATRLRRPLRGAGAGAPLLCKGAIAPKKTLPISAFSCPSSRTATGAFQVES